MKINPTLFAITALLIALLACQGTAPQSVTNTPDSPATQVPAKPTIEVTTPEANTLVAEFEGQELSNGGIIPTSIEFRMKETDLALLYVEIRNSNEIWIASPGEDGKFEDPELGTTLTQEGEAIGLTVTNMDTGEFWDAGILVYQSGYIIWYSPDALISPSSEVHG